ncbi:hypothetical protein PRZ48_006089 [Zasmidium cellare]|uniref:GPI mannosyltransferase 2 n=1 Tax=Zasmidium cellare TaxID=395010 RepID=A0ABR0ENH6_ZASCE|nr:hypothetical protein PRZ48_006089 [Zasmidium cellare]
MARNTGSTSIQSTQAASKTASPDTSIGRLTRVFWVWKLLLLTIAAVSPGPGYDTSTQILFDRYPSYSESGLAEASRWLAAKLTRWDAIYFTNTAARGVVFEQEWAFSPVFSKLVSLVAGACLHVISPGGLFLSAFYGESAFALLNFCGLALLVSASPSQNNTSSVIYDASKLVASGLAFGLASVVRSNGIFSGIILAWDAVAYLPSLPRILEQKQWNHLIRLAAILLGGSLILVCQILLQGTAYVQYCTKGNWRTWCGWLPPSIYTWVQQHYWGVGFLRYWTLSNAPLFALAAPMSVVLLGTGIVALQRAPLMEVLQNALAEGKSPDEKIASADQQRFAGIMARCALPQVVLAALALTSFHVQIVNRISSGYPLWYIIIAITIHADKSSTMQRGFFLRWLGQHSTFIVRVMAMYAIVQGGLYATFMPPA